MAAASQSSPSPPPSRSCTRYRVSGQNDASETLVSLTASPIASDKEAISAYHKKGTYVHVGFFRTVKGVVCSYFFIMLLWNKYNSVEINSSEQNIKPLLIGGIILIASTINIVIYVRNSLRYEVKTIN